MMCAAVSGRTRPGVTVKAAVLQQVSLKDLVRHDLEAEILRDWGATVVQVSLFDHEPVRTEGSATVVDAALVAGVARLVQESAAPVSERAGGVPFGGCSN